MLEHAEIAPTFQYVLDYLQTCSRWSLWFFFSFSFRINLNHRFSLPLSSTTGTWHFISNSMSVSTKPDGAYPISGSRIYSQFSMKALLPICCSFIVRDNLVFYVHCVFLVVPFEKFVLSSESWFPWLLFNNKI